MTVIPTKQEQKSKEPALAVGSSVGSVAGILTLIAFIFPNALNERQTTIILVIAAFALPLVTAVFTRGKVWSPSTVKEAIDEATSDALSTINGLHDQAATDRREIARLRNELEKTLNQ